MARGLTRTGVEWAVNPDGSPGFCGNVITGCLNGCEYCYARELANGRLRELYLANTRFMSPDFRGKSVALVRMSTIRIPNAQDPFEPRWWPERLEAIRRRRKPAGIFMVDMGDAFGPWVPSWILQAILEVVRECPQHRFYFLTKFPERLAEFNPWPENCWVGATATDTPSFHGARIGLTNVEARVKYISVEPLLSWEYLGSAWALATGLKKSEIDWLIVGPCTGRLRAKYPCRREWIEEIVAACDAAGIAVFEKDACAPLVDRPLRREWPSD